MRDTEGHGRTRRRPEQASCSHGVATGLSGGIDSFSVLADHHYAADLPRVERLTHLLYNNVGSHGRHGDGLFLKRLARLRPTAERIGLPLVTVNSNLDDFFGAHLAFQPTITPRNAAVAHLLQRGIGTALIASSYPYRWVKVARAGDSSYADPIILPILSTGALTLNAVGSEYRRVEKIAQAAELADSWDCLDVCVLSTDGTNCSRCWKCVRTMLTLEILGKLERYEAVFDMDVYRQCSRDPYIADVMTNWREPVTREVVVLARERGFPVPAGALKALPGVVAPKVRRVVADNVWSARRWVREHR